MENIFEINVKKIFTLSQVDELLPVIVKLTESAQGQVKQIMSRFEVLPEKSSAKSAELEVQVNEVIDRWQSKIEKLGGKPKGLWLADFDFGMGYFCWKFPENKIRFWHGYEDGFSGRKSIEELHPN